MSGAGRTIANDPLVGALADLGRRYDADVAYPFDSMALLARTGLLRRYAPASAGGERFADPSDRAMSLYDALRRVGRGDLALGRLFEGHVNALALFDWYASPSQLAWLRERLAADAVFGVWATEPPPGVALLQAGGKYRLSGAKCFASGAGGIDHAIVTVQPDAGGERRLAIVAADDPRRTDLAGWTVRGMRASVSGTYDLSDQVVEPDALLGLPGDYDREPRFTSGAWRFAAVQLGGIEALVAEVRAMMSPTAQGDPLSRAGFGLAVVAARSAGVWVRRAAGLAAIEHSDAATFARMSRGVVERAGLDVMEQAARLVGTRSAFTGQRVDKIIRDLSLYLRQAGPDQARDAAVCEWLDHDCWGDEPWW